MCSCNNHRPEIPPWARSAWIGDIRRLVTPALIALGLTALLAYQLGPTDIERAEADLQKAREVVLALEEEADRCQAAAAKYRARSAEYRGRAHEEKDTTDREWLERQHAIAEGNDRLFRANYDRRNTLTHLTAQYLRLLAEAEGEVLRAKDARDRGTPYPVAPRVRDLLAPILNTR